jgi:hypothetical protein
MRRLLTLGEILKPFECHKLALISSLVQMTLHNGEFAIAHNKGTDTFGANLHVQNLIGQVIALAEDIFPKVGLVESLRQLQLAKTVLLQPDLMNSFQLKSELNRIQTTLFTEIHDRKFLLVDATQTLFVDNEALLGPDIYECFAKARLDVKEAGNCIAADCNTAAVFHLMRVAEYGLRAVAGKLRVKLKNKGVNQPIEYADWQDVINGVKNKIVTTRALPRSKKKEQRLEFYSDIADQCEYIKDIWRNTISHTRKPYNAPEAVGVLFRVSGFMKKLASDIKRAK